MDNMKEVFEDEHWSSRGSSKFLTYTGALPSDNLDLFEVKDFVRRRGAWGAIWNYDHDYATEGPWYRCICDTKGYNEENIPSKNVRHNLHRSLKRCSFRQIDFNTLAQDGHDVYLKATTRYNDFKAESKKSFSEQILQYYKTENAEAFGVFVDDKLVAYMTVIISSESARGDIAAFDPSYSSAYPMYCLYFKATQYYLNERGLMEFDRGTRPLVHETGIDDFLLRLGFRKAYCRLGLFLAWPIRVILKIARPLRTVWGRILPVRYKSILEGLLNAEDFELQTKKN